MFARRFRIALCVFVATTGMTGGYAVAQNAQQYFPLVTFRTGPYAPSGVPLANGFADYIKLLNLEGGIGGVTLLLEECETGYATDKGVECYERLKGKFGGATAFHTMSTGITFALTPKGAADGIPILTVSYGISQSADGLAYKWSFPVGGTHWASADLQFKYVLQRAGGLDKIKGKKIALLYHDSPYGKEPIHVLTRRSDLHGFQLNTIPVAHPGVEQKSAWLQIRRLQPDYVLLWGWGVMNSTALREAQNIGYPRDRVIGIWASGSDSDVAGVNDAKGYSAVILAPGPGRESKIVKKIIDKIYNGKSEQAFANTVGSALYMRGLLSAIVSAEGVRVAQAKYGVGRQVTPAQARWGYENINIDEKRLQELGVNDILRPIRTTCVDHMGPAVAKAYTWTGSDWQASSDWITTDGEVLGPLLKDVVQKEVADGKTKLRDIADCES